MDPTGGVGGIPSCNLKKSARFLDTPIRRAKTNKSVDFGPSRAEAPIVVTARERSSAPTGFTGGKVIAIRFVAQSRDLGVEFDRSARAAFRLPANHLFTISSVGGFAPEPH